METRPRMPLSERAKIFIPFNPLRGFREALRERERIVEEQAELPEDRLAELDRALGSLALGDEVALTYVSGGDRHKIRGPYGGVLALTGEIAVGKERVALADVIDMDCQDRE